MSEAQRAPWTVIVPAKPPAEGKSRLTIAGVDRLALNRAIVLDTLDAIRRCRLVDQTVLVSSDDGWPLPPGVRLVAEPEPAGIAAAVARGLAAVPADSNRAVAVADLPGLRPGDLETALRLATSVDRGGVADREGTGTTLVTARSGVSLVAEFGADSWRRHLGAGLRHLAVGADSSLRRDVDRPGHLEDRNLGRRTRAVLEGVRPVSRI